MFKNRDTEKIYWAIVSGMPPENEGFLEHFLIRNEKTNTSRAFEKEIKGSKIAQLQYKVVTLLDRYNLLEIKLITGRHHQIRVQLSTVGCIIKGDLKYGASRSNADGGIHLHAKTLTITHPVTLEKMTFTAPPPLDPLWKTIGLLNK
jgi:23S rRNA pseudouridine1911/1915/1917 synthase